MKAFTRKELNFLLFERLFVDSPVGVHLVLLHRQGLHLVFQPPEEEDGDRAHENYSCCRAKEEGRVFVEGEAGL